MNFDYYQLPPEEMQLLHAKTLLIQAFLNLLSSNHPVHELDNMPQQDKNLIDKKHSLFNKIVQEIPIHLAKEHSKKERVLKEMSSNSLTYGEIDFHSFAEIFYMLNLKHPGLIKPQGVFYDLGSGVGKGVIASTLLHNFDKCIGVEILESLHKLALKMKDRYEDFVQDYKDDEEKIKWNEERGSGGVQEDCELEEKNIVEGEEKTKLDARIKFANVEFVNEDILKLDWTDGSFIFANSTCFEGDLMFGIAKAAARLAKDTIFVTFTKRLPDNVNWKILEVFKRSMSWGDATIFIQIKATDPCEIAEKQADNEIHVKAGNVVAKEIEQGYGIGKENDDEDNVAE